MDKYILDKDGNPQKCDSLDVWSAWFEASGPSRAIGSDVSDDNMRVSTVFLGIDHGFSLLHPGQKSVPILYETMVFDDSHTGRASYQMRYATKEEALEGHARAVKKFIKKPASRMQPDFTLDEIHTAQKLTT